ncbi:MAG: carbohydrate ABC transporter permease [Eubacteriales bacterium]|nr:carbohydrate ABC transporter permease [Eubacteriales bacterium]
MIKKIGVYLLLILAAFLSLFPFYFMFVSGTNTNADILSAPPRLIPGSMLAQNFSVLIEKMDIFRVAFNTLFMSILFVLLAVLLYSAAGYVLAKFEFRGKGLIFGFIMVSMMIPPQVMYVPLFQMFISANMTNTYASVILPSLANAFGIFLMRQNMVNFPTALIEAARIDGYNEFQIYLRIVLPNIKPALSALVIYMFTSMWNNFMWPLIVLETKSMYNFPVALAVLDGNPTNKDFAVILLATAIATLPILIIFMLFQKQFVAGVMGGAVKE